MARFHITSNWRATFAFAVFLVFAVTLLFAAFAQTRLGPLLYVLCLASIGLGFWAREDNAAMGGVIGLNLLVMLDVVLRIGILP